MPVNSIANPAAAASAYANTAKTMQVPGLDAGKDDSFAEVMKKTALEAVETLHGGEKASAQAVMGTANLTDVVQAVTAAELTLQTVVAVRDRMLTAYQEIMRMPI
jgi:flagellar hook-basal body complex protein FliE